MVALWRWRTGGDGGVTPFVRMIVVIVKQVKKIGV